MHQRSHAILFESVIPGTREPNHFITWHYTEVPVICIMWEQHETRSQVHFRFKWWGVFHYHSRHRLARDVAGLILTLICLAPNRLRGYHALPYVMPSCPGMQSCCRGHCGSVLHRRAWPLCVIGYDSLSTA